MRVFKTKTFARWMRKEGLKDVRLLNTIREMEDGQFEASLGGNVYKKRIALPGRGKSGSVRTLSAFRGGDRAFFIFGFAKNERANIDVLELTALKLMAKTLFEKSNTKLNKDLEANVLVEVQNDGWQDSQRTTQNR